MSILIRAALLGGLAYVVSRAVRHNQGSNYLSEAGARRLSRPDEDPNATWPSAQQHLTGNL